MSEIAVKLTNVTKTFGNQIVHNDLSLELPKGKTSVIVGHSGAGKSVMLKYILGLIQPDKGEILVDGKDVTKLNQRGLYDIRSKFGVLFQGAALLDSLNVYDNVALPLREKTKLSEEEIKKSVMEKLDLMGIADSIHKFPAELSGGMQKRVGLARALQRKPEIVLFDEPTTGLDPETTHNIYKLFKSTQAALAYTAIIVSHDIPKVFAIADHIAVLYKGVISDFLTPEQIESSGNVWLNTLIKLEKETI
jgi:phospholipid/cholesterol/gamma-HCH transport system ATP-binding protein